MSTLKKVQVVMLPTNEKANLFIDKNQLLYFPDHKRSYVEWKDVQYQHLYFLSNEEIKEGDWVYNSISKEIYQFKENHVDYENKIIATTDSSLKIHPMQMNTPHYDYLPEPSQSFLEVYVREYNRGHQIKEVQVEYEEHLEFSDNTQGRQAIINLEKDWYRLKVNPKDNTITIKRVKESWNREEVIELLDKISDDCFYQEGSGFDFSKWVEQNL